MINYYDNDEDSKNEIIILKIFVGLGLINLVALFLYPIAFYITSTIFLTFTFYIVLTRMKLFNRLYGADEKDFLNYLINTKSYKEFKSTYGKRLPELYKYEFEEMQDIKMNKLFVVKYDFEYSNVMKNYMDFVNIRYAEGSGEKSFKSIKERDYFINSILQRLKEVSSYCCYYYLSKYSEEEKEEVFTILNHILLGKLEIFENEYTLRYDISYKNGVIELSAEIEIFEDMLNERFETKGIESLLGIDTTESKFQKSAVIECTNEFEVALIIHRANAAIKDFISKEMLTVNSLIKEQVTQEFRGNIISNMDNSHKIGI